MRDGTVVTYYAKTFVFKARKHGWKDKPLDVGYNELVGDKNLNTQKLRQIVDSSGLPLKKPWPLNGSGAKKPNATDSPAVLEFLPYAAADWSWKSPRVSTVPRWREQSLLSFCIYN